MSRRERWARRVVGVVIACDLAVGLTGNVLGPGLYLFIRPWLIDGAGLLGAFAVVIGLGSAGLSWAGCATWRRLVDAPPQVPRALLGGTFVGMLLLFPGLAWGIWLVKYAVEGNAFWGYEWLAAEATAVLLLPLVPIVGALVSRARFGRTLREAVPSESPGARSFARWGPRIAGALAVGVPITALTWPGGPPESVGTTPIEGRLPHEWLAALDTSDATAPPVAMRHATELIPDLAASLVTEHGVRWSVAQWFGWLAALGNSVAPMLGEVHVPGSHVRVALILARRAGPSGAPLASPLVRRLPLVNDSDADGIVVMLQRLGDEVPRPVVDMLRIGLQSADVKQRVRAARACLAIGRDAPTRTAAVDALRSALASPDWSTQGPAILALGRLGAEGAPALPDLLAALSDPKVGTQATAREALAAIARADPAARDRLRTELLTRPGDRHAIAHALALAAGETPEVLEWLGAGLAAGEARGAGYLWVASRLGRPAASLLPGIDAMLGSTRPRVACLAAIAATAIGGPTDARLAPLRAALALAPSSSLTPILSDFEARPDVAPALAPEFQALLATSTPDLRLRMRVAALVVRSGIDVPGGLAAIESGLRAPQIHDRLAAVEAARSCGPTAAPLAELLRVFRDGDGAFWDLSHDAIDAVEGRTPPR